MSEAMNIIIAGSRDFDNYRLLKKTVSDYIEENQVNNTQQIRVISGGAKGADRLGECYAFDNGYSVIRFQALWGVYGKSAGPRRNNEYFNIGKNKLRELVKEPGCTFVMYSGNRCLIKRQKFEKYLDSIVYL